MPVVHDNAQEDTCWAMTRNCKFLVQNATTAALSCPKQPSKHPYNCQPGEGAYRLLAGDEGGSLLPPWLQQARRQPHHQYGHWQHHSAHTRHPFSSSQHVQVCSQVGLNHIMACWTPCSQPPAQTHHLHSSSSNTQGVEHGDSTRLTVRHHSITQGPRRPLPASFVSV